MTRRQIVLDTETTGLEPADGHRIIEIGCIELVNRRTSDRVFHHYCNPEREVEQGALDVHGITNEFLKGKPRFQDVANDFIDFVRDSELIIHNAAFDISFLDAELKRLGSKWGCMADHCTSLDSLDLARELHPGQRNGLDALCKRYEIDNSARQLHGALLDAELLAEVYLAMTGGQVALLLDTDAESNGPMVRARSNSPVTARNLVVVEASEEELDQHDARVAAINAATDGRCLWTTLAAAGAS